MVAEAVKSDVALIDELIHEYVQTIKDGDMEGWLALWLPEGKQMASGVPARIGHEAIREGNRPLFELFMTEMTIHPDELRILGDHAYTHGNYDYAMTPREGGTAIHRQRQIPDHPEEAGRWYVEVRHRLLQR